MKIVMNEGTLVIKRAKNDIYSLYDFKKASEDVKAILLILRMNGVGCSFIRGTYEYENGTFMFSVWWESDKADIYKLLEQFGTTTSMDGYECKGCLYTRDYAITLNNVKTKEYSDFELCCMPNVFDDF